MVFQMPPRRRILKSLVMSVYNLTMYLHACIYIHFYNETPVPFNTTGLCLITYLIKKSCGEIMYSSSSAIPSGGRWEPNGFMWPRWNISSSERCVFWELQPLLYLPPQSCCSLWQPLGNSSRQLDHFEKMVTKRITSTQKDCLILSSCMRAKINQSSYHIK